MELLMIQMTRGPFENMGWWVRESDYNSLVAENARLESRIAALLAPSIERFCTPFGHLKDFGQQDMLAHFSPP